MTKFLGYTWVGWLNILVLQWLFVRLAREIDIETGATESYAWIKGVVPLTGWFGRFWFVADDPYGDLWNPRHSKDEEL